MRGILTNVAAVGLLLAATRGAAAQPVTIETVTVGNPGNLGELSGESVNIAGNIFGVRPDRVCGIVNYTFQMGKFEVTAGQYTAFLNAVAASDPHNLYNGQMAEAPASPTASRIERSGKPGSYTYSVAPDWANRPVGFVSWDDAARFANWMHNGQPTGAQDLSTTEDGSYFLDGRTTNLELQDVARLPGATWVIPSEDEWYKAAYHRNDGPTGSYWHFPTQSDTTFFGAHPDNDVIDPDPGNNANFWQATFDDPDDDCIGPPYWRTEVGEFENSESAYGTFDQGGNQWEWNDTRLPEQHNSHRVCRGGSYYNLLNSWEQLHAAYRWSTFAMTQTGRFGFRVARVANDCNANGVFDSDDIAAGTSTDHNYNYVPDECDIASGTSLDCNGNDIPDEVEAGLVTPPPYRWDDGVPEAGVGLIPGGVIAWLSQFTVAPGHTTIDAVAIAYGDVLDRTPVTIHLWSDPDGDGNPSDAAVLMGLPTTVVNANTGIMNIVEIPPTFVGPAGTSFFVGALIEHAAGELPAAIDATSQQRHSWIAGDVVSLDPNDLDGGDLLGLVDDFDLAGNWTIQAHVVPPITPNDCNANGVPDDCDIAGGAPDTNGNGIPDECEKGLCPWDLDGSGVVGTADMLDLLAAWGSDPGGPPDFDGDGTVGTSDLLALLGQWGPCP